MKVAELIEKRQPLWRELESLCNDVGSRGKSSPEKISRFSSLYRSACADLALAESYQLPPNTVDYLHRLVSRATASCTGVGNSNGRTGTKAFLSTRPN